MKIIDVIGRVDDLKPNTWDVEHKIGWLSKLDLMIQKNIINTHEDGSNTPFTGYDVDVDQQTELLAPPPYDEMYIYWIEAQIDLANQEYNKYNASIMMFNTEWQEYENYYNRQFMPITSGKQRFLF